jgi:hemerythrin-like domain-containing protein
MPDLLTRLEQEHREVERLLDELEDTEEPEERRPLLSELETALRQHMEDEEQLLYPKLREVEPSLAEEAEVEHQGARELLERVASMVDEPGFGSMVAALKGAIAHHVEEEEDEAFPVLRDALSADELRRLDETARGKGGGSGGGGVRGGRGGPEQDRTRDELYERAKQLGIEGRSTMTRDELDDAVSSAEQRS